MSLASSEVRAVGRFISIALSFVKVYVAAIFLSVVIAHVLLIATPQSGWGERVIRPITRGLAFSDAHWKALLILIAPFLLTLARDLAPRLRKIGSIEFDAVSLEAVAVREKPSPESSGAA
jgi:hypothetical protein